MHDDQNHKLLAALKRGPLTAMDALDELGIARAAARIHELREAGHVIDSHAITVTNRDGKPCRVAEYRLVTPQRELFPQHPGRGVLRN